jgi:hypothetical protein
MPLPTGAIKGFLNKFYIQQKITIYSSLGLNSVINKSTKGLITLALAVLDAIFGHFLPLPFVVNIKHY